jgi:hypothetical protein
MMIKNIIFEDGAKWEARNVACLVSFMHIISCMLLESKQIDKKKGIEQKEYERNG